MNTKCLTMLLSIPFLASALCAQTQKTQALSMAMGANSKQMVAYQWKQKTTILRRGSQAAFKIDEIHFDATGQPQRVTIAKSEERRMGPLMARRAAEIKDSVQDVMQLASRYANPQEISQAIRKGEIWEGQGSLRVQARSVILPIDEMTMLVNGSSYLPLRIDFKTQYEGSPVAIAIDYQQLPNGPSMMARMTVQIPKEDVVVNVESYDFMRLAGPMVP